MQNPFEQTDKNKLDIVWNKQLNAWTVSSYSTVLSILKDKRFSASGANIQGPNSFLPTISEDPSAAQKELIQALQQESSWVHQVIQETIDFYCQQKKDLKNFDLYQELLLPCCQELALKFTDSVNNNNNNLLENAQLVFEGNEQAQEATILLSTYFLKKISLAKQNPSKGFVSLLAQTSAEPYLILSPIIQLFVGVSTSLPLLLSNSLSALLSNPDQEQKYLINPKQSLNELLRYAGPAKIVFRLALDRINIGTHSFEPGDRIALFLGLANLDSQQFSCPHQLDFSRSSVAHLSLGIGVHACLGASIIKAALKLIPTSILNHFPKITVDSEKSSLGGSPTIQGFTSLIVHNG